MTLEALQQVDGPAVLVLVVIVIRELRRVAAAIEAINERLGKAEVRDEYLARRLDTPPFGVAVETSGPIPRRVESG